MISHALVMIRSFTQQSKSYKLAVETPKQNVHINHNAHISFSRVQNI